MAASSSGPFPSPRRALTAGLAAGAVAALVASLVSLPLRSPDDAFFNTASVTIGALLTGLAGGLAWWAVRRRGASWRVFVAGMAATFTVVAAAALVSEALPNAPLEGLARFVLPLAAIIFGVVAALTPFLYRAGLSAGLLASAGTVAALGLGIVLAGRGDAESGTLALPSAPAPPPAARSEPQAPAASPAVGAASEAGSPRDGLLRRADVAGLAFGVVPGESAATYTVREKLARLPLPSEAVGRTTQVSGTIYLDGRPSRVTVDLRTLQSDQPRRDDYIRTNPNGPQLNRYPFAEFTVANLVDLPAEYRPGETVTGSVTGTMEIREVGRPLTFPVTARLQANALYFTAPTKITSATFPIRPPTIAGVSRVEASVRATVLQRAM